MISLPDDISIHVFKGVKLLDIYDKTTGFPRLDNILRTDGADRDGDITANLKAVNLDKEWAKNRNREIENEVEFLRDQKRFFTTHYPDIDREHIEVIRENIKNLLEERDDITYKYGLAGKHFDSEYEARMERENEGADEDGLITFSNGTKITKMGSDFDKSLMDTTLVQESNGDIKLVVEENRFRFITEEMHTLYSQKNTDYGDAFTQSLDEDGLLVSKIRIKDKLNRFSQLINNDALVNDESMRDTLIDMANYAVMTMMWLDENE